MIEMGNNFDIKYIVYLTTNIISKKIYVGVHKTETPDKFDGYLGCGSWINEPSSYNKGNTPLHCAILKYGTKAFVRKTLKVFNTRAEALNLEKQIVNEDFIKRTDTYNAVIGGGDPPLLTKAVYQFDTTGNFVKKWDSETDINKYYECKIQMLNIIKNKQNFAGSFWAFEDSINVSEYTLECNRGFISQYNENGILLNTFKNTTIAAQKLDINREAITRAVFKKSMYSGYYFVKSGVDIAEVISRKYKPVLGKFIVYRYLSTGEYDTKFTSIRQAELNTPKIGQNSLKKSIVNRKLAGGYYWAFEIADNYFSIANPSNKKDIKIAQYTKNGELVKIWNSPKECKKEFPYALQVCQGKAKSTKNYVFKYIQD